MPTRGASRGGLSGQLSMNDDLVNQLMGSAAGPTKSFSVEQFAEMFKPPAAGGAAGGAATTSADASSPRGRARRGSANPTTSSGSGKTSEEIWKNIQLSGADSLQGPPSILPTPQGSGAFGTVGTLTGKLSLPTGSMLFPQKSIERLVGEHAGGAARPATEWMDLMLASIAPSAPPGPGLQPTRSARLALEKAAERLVTEMDASPMGMGARSAARGARGASLLGRTAPVRKDAPAAAAGSKRGAAGTAGAKKRGRAALEAADAERVPFTLPPKKKGRKKKGEVDTETEEEKKLRAEERQRKNRESAARSHRRKAQYTEDLERRAEAGERRIAALERENAKLKSELAKLRDAAAGAKRTASGNKSK